MWTVSSADSHTGTYAARAGSMPMGGSSTLEITLDCLPGSLSFFRKLACPGGLLIFYVDGEAIGEWTGFTEWDTLPVQYEVAAGSHTFKWEYWDVLGDPAGTVWLDDICFPPLTGVHTVAITSGPSGSPNPVGPNGDVICSVGAFDSLGHNLNYQWSCASGSFNDPTLPQPTWTAPATAGDHEITVTVTCSEDGTSSDTGSYVQQVADVVVTGINPDSGSNDGVVNVAIGGQGFEPGATAQLAKAGQLPIAGMGVTVVSSSQITCAFNLLGVAEGYWDVVVTNPGGESGVLRGGFNVTGAVDEDFETGNLSKWPWVTHGDSNWSVTGTDPRTGTYSAEAGGMWESGSAFLEITLDCEPGEISFYKKLYCLGGLVIFYVDGAPISEWSGITEWDATPFEYSVARGSHTFKWEYWDVLGDPLGYAWLDDISFPPIIGTHGVNIIAGPEGTPNPVASEGDVQCSVTASDSLGHALTYLWSADGGTFDDATLAEPTWTAPANATGTVAEYQISVTVTCAEDATVSDTASYTQQVSSVEHTVGISAGPAGDPNPCASAADVALSVTASDSLGHALTYLWSADGGTFDDATLATPTWTAPANATGTVAEYQISVTVTCAEDATVSDTASYTQQVSSVAHEIVVAYEASGDPNPVDAGGSVQCSVAAEDTLGHPIKFYWSADAGSFRRGTSAAPVWTAPDTPGDYQVTVTITCARDSSIMATSSYIQRVEPRHEVTITDGPSGTPNPVITGGNVRCSVGCEDSIGHDLTYLWSADGGSFNDPTLANPIWTAPDRHGNYQITVTVTCAEDASISATASYRQRVARGRAKSFSPGIRMVSVPLIPDIVDPAHSGFDVGTWARWDPVTGDYVHHSSDPTGYTGFGEAEKVPGRGYWVRFTRETDVAVAGIPVLDSTYAVALPAGWSQIGNPRLTDVPWTALRVRHNGVEMTLAEAHAAGWCEDFAWAYRSGAGYRLVHDPSVATVGEYDRIRPWEGYWFQTYRPLELVFPSTAEVASIAPQPAAARAEGEWIIPLVAVLDDGSRAQAIVGQASQPRRMDLPPSFGSDVQLSITRGQRKLGVDLQQPGPGAVWTLDAACGIAGARITLRWPDLGELPHDYRPMLVDMATGRRTYMRTSQGYSFTTGGADEARRFEVRVAPATQGTLVTTATASAASGASMELRVSLSTAATIDAAVINIAGRQVGTVCRGRDVDEGTSVLLWDLMSDHGTRLPGGMYLIRVTARTEEGQQASLLAPLQLQR